MSGWVVESLPDSLIADLERAGIPPAASRPMKGFAELYRSLRDDDELEPTLSEIRADLVSFGRMVAKLRERLQSPPFATLEAVSTAAHLARCPDLLDRLRVDLEFLDVMIAAAWQKSEPRVGRGGSRRTWLALQFAKLLEDSGINPTASKSGHLCQALRLTLTAAGEPSLHFERLARTALDKKAAGNGKV